MKIPFFVFHVFGEGDAIPKNRRVFHRIWGEKSCIFIRDTVFFIKILSEGVVFRGLGKHIKTKTFLCSLMTASHIVILGCLVGAP